MIMAMIVFEIQEAHTQILGLLIRISAQLVCLPACLPAYAKILLSPAENYFTLERTAKGHKCCGIGSLGAVAENPLQHTTHNPACPC